MLNKIGFIAASFVFIFSGTGIPAENSTQLYMKGAELAKEGRIDEAITIFKDVIKKSPYYCLGHYGLGKTYLYKSNRLKDALRHLKYSVFLDKKYAKGYFYLGMAYMLMKKYPPAIKAFDLSFKNDSSIIEALFNIAVIYDTTNDIFKSKLYFSKYLNLKKRSGREEIF